MRPLVLVEYATGRVYAVPFDRSALHLESVWDATPEWLSRNFEWTRDSQRGRGGAAPTGRTGSVDGNQLSLFYSESSRKLWLMAIGTPGVEPVAGDHLVDQIGRRFNAELARGWHQGLLAEYPPSD
jgi:hypothetical protein